MDSDLQIVNKEVSPYKGLDQPVLSHLIESMHALAVLLQAVRPREGLVTGGADIGAVAGMDAHVCGQVDGCREGVAAGGADVGAVAGMGAHVCRQAAGRRASLAAGGAGEIGRASCRERV